MARRPPHRISSFSCSVKGLSTCSPRLLRPRGSLSAGPRNGGLACSKAAFKSQSFGSSFRCHRSLEAREGLAPLGSRTVGRRESRLCGRAAPWRRYPWEPASAGPWVPWRRRKDRSIRSDVQQNSIRVRTRSGVKSFAAADGRQPFMLQSISRTLPLSFPSVLPPEA
jgi:hypothetical protein